MSLESIVTLAVAALAGIAGFILVMNLIVPNKKAKSTMAWLGDRKNFPAIMYILALAAMYAGVLILAVILATLTYWGIIPFWLWGLLVFAVGGFCLYAWSRPLKRRKTNHQGRISPQAGQRFKIVLACLVLLAGLALFVADLWPRWQLPRVQATASVAPAWVATEPKRCPPGVLLGEKVDLLEGQDHTFIKDGYIVTFQCRNGAVNTIAELIATPVPASDTIEIGGKDGPVPAFMPRAPIPTIHLSTLPSTDEKGRKVTVLKGFNLAEFGGNDAKCNRTELDSIHIGEVVSSQNEGCLAVLEWSLKVGSDTVLAGTYSLKPGEWFYIPLAVAGVNDRVRIVGTLWYLPKGWNSHMFAADLAGDRDERDGTISVVGLSPTDDYVVKTANSLLGK